MSIWMKAFFCDYDLDDDDYEEGYAKEFVVDDIASLASSINGELSNLTPSGHSIVLSGFVIKIDDSREVDDEEVFEELGYDFGIGDDQCDSIADSDVVMLVDAARRLSQQ